MSAYKSDKITVTTSYTEIRPSNFNRIYNWSVYPIDGDIVVQLKVNGEWGDEISSFQGVAIGDTALVTAIRVKSQTGSVEIAYYLRGN